ncbi:MAG: hypothetical protein IKZ37_00505 [Bacteroidaceae bacterium]|nr:hypothetical protein [Bacteroidaceae bacterium]
MSPLFSIEETINKYYGQKKRLLLLLDDMDIVLANMERTEQFRLRSLLYREGAPIIIGTGTELANDLIDYQAPFYDAFILFHLKELSQDVAIELLNKMRVKSNFHKIDTSSEIVSFIFDEIGRTPENCRILANIPHLNAKRDIILRKALKPLSLYYRDKIMNLSPSQRKTLIFMLSEKRPVLLKEIREGTNQSAGDISPQLKALSNKGLISTIKQRAKKTEYSITDKLMVLWYKNCIEKDTLCAAIDKL